MFCISVTKNILKLPIWLYFNNIFNPIGNQQNKYLHSYTYVCVKLYYLYISEIFSWIFLSSYYQIRYFMIILIDIIY